MNLILKNHEGEFRKEIGKKKFAKNNLYQSEYFFLNENMNSFGKKIKE